MFVGIYVEPTNRRPKRIIDLECDYCGSPFEAKFSAKYAAQPKHYCSRQCSQAEHRHLCMEARNRPDVIAKQQATVQARYGVRSMLSLPEVHALANTPEKCRQRHETMKKNGTYFTSKPEDDLYRHLIGRYGEADVMRQAVINKWPIDFYIKSVDTYVQLDGAYWHGLDRSLEDIKEFRTPRDRTILRKYQIDREQDEWFRSTGRCLLRITDRQFARGDIPDELK